MCDSRSLPVVVQDGVQVSWTYGKFSHASVVCRIEGVPAHAHGLEEGGTVKGDFQVDVEDCKCTDKK